MTGPCPRPCISGGRSVRVFLWLLTRPMVTAVRSVLRLARAYIDMGD
jgi:hypothetical protein